MKTKEFFVIISLIIFSILLYVIFPVKGDIQDIISMIFFLVIIPILFNKIILKKSLKEIGIQVGDWKEGIKWCFYSTIVIGLVFFIVIYFFDFLKNYSLFSIQAESFFEFIFYELIIIIFAVLVYEFFFRGFVLMKLEKKMGYWAIAAQVLFFIVFIEMSNFSLWELSPYVIFSPFAGIIAYKSKSILYSGAMQALILIFLDAGAIYINK